jgi:uncharacterized membrane protein
MNLYINVYMYECASLNSNCIKVVQIYLTTMLQKDMYIFWCCNYECYMDSRHITFITTRLCLSLYVNIFE